MTSPRSSSAALVSCPMCGAAEVSKKLSAPRLNLRRDAGRRARASGRGGGAPAAADMQAAWMALARRGWPHTEDVGERFVEEARRIHYGESPERGIRGQASRAETEALLEGHLGDALAARRAQERAAVARRPQLVNCSAARRAYTPPCATSVACVPCSTMRPCSIHDDAVGLLHGGQAVRDHQRRAVAHGRVQRRLHLALARRPARWWPRPAAAAAGFLSMARAIAMRWR